MSELALVAVAPARATIAHHSKSFALASRLLGPRERDQTAVVYTWCRRADDAVDAGEATDLTLARLRRELDDAYAGCAADPVLAAFGAVARARAIPRAYPGELLAGMAMDVRGDQYRTLDDLLVYCWRVAGVVGLMMSHVFGVSDDDALVSAAHLGMAMQLTNICRDVAEDWERGRVYIPDELLGAPLEPGQPLPRAPLASAVAELLCVADRYYRSGDRGIRALPWRAAIAVRAARRIYAAIGREIARTGYDVLAGRAIVPPHRKLAHALAAAASGVVAAPLQLFREPAAIPRRTLELSDV